MDPYTKEVITGENSDKVATYKPTSLTDSCAYVWGRGNMESKDCDTRSRMTLCFMGQRMTAIFRLVCGMCQLPERQMVMVKGLCDKNVVDEQEYDRSYYIFGLENGKVHFR